MLPAAQTARTTKLAKHQHMQETTTNTSPSSSPPSPHTVEDPQNHVTQENGFQLISQGAEARVFQGVYMGRDAIVKERFRKIYRHPTLDKKITARRVASEAKILAKCKLQLVQQQKAKKREKEKEEEEALFDVPAVYFVDPYRHYMIYMEHVNGSTVKRFLISQFMRFQERQRMEKNRTDAMTENDDEDVAVRDSIDELPTGEEMHEFDETLFMGDGAHVECYDDTAFQLMHRIGQSIALLHNNQIVHGDLTTSNMLLRDDNPSKLVMIDFGLSYMSHLEEDKAVDLYVLERALISTHPYSQQLFEKLLEGYSSGKNNKRAKTVLDRLSQVQLRGRKRSMVG